MVEKSVSHFDLLCTARAIPDDDLMRNVTSPRSDGND
jgi:hypothetical protein